MLGLEMAACRGDWQDAHTANPLSPKTIRGRNKLDGFLKVLFLKMERLKRTFAFQALIRKREQRVSIDHCPSFLLKESFFSSASELLTDRINEI